MPYPFDSQVFKAFKFDSGGDRHFVVTRPVYPVNQTLKDLAIGEKGLGFFKNELATSAGYPVLQGILYDVASINSQGYEIYRDDTGTELFPNFFASFSSGSARTFIFPISFYWNGTVYSTAPSYSGVWMRLLTTTPKNYVLGAGINAAGQFFVILHDQTTNTVLSESAIKISDFFAAGQVDIVVEMSFDGSQGCIVTLSPQYNETDSTAFNAPLLWIDYTGGLLGTVTSVTWAALPVHKIAPMLFLGAIQSANLPGYGGIGGVGPFWDAVYCKYDYYPNPPVRLTFSDAIKNQIGNGLSATYKLKFYWNRRYIIPGWLEDNDSQPITATRAIINNRSSFTEISVIYGGYETVIKPKDLYILDLVSGYNELQFVGKRFCEPSVTIVADNINDKFLTFGV